MRWLAVLALVPAMAWGQCFSAAEREAFGELAMTIADMRERGVTEREALQVARQIDEPGAKAAFLEGVRLIYSPMPANLSSAVTLMQSACDAELSP